MKILNQLVSEFAHYCRENDMDVPTSILIETLQVLPYIQMTNKEDFFLTLRQLWIKERDLYERFELCFEEFFIRQILIKTAESHKKMRHDYYEEKLQKVVSNKEKKELKAGKGKGEEPAEDNSNALEWLKEKLKTKSDGLALLFKQELEKELTSNFEHTSELFTHIMPSDINELAEELMWDAVLSGQESVVFDAIEAARHSLVTFRNAVNKIKKESLTELSNIEKTIHTGMRKMIQTEIDTLQNKSIQQLSKNEIQILRDSLERSSLKFMTRFSKLLKGSKQEAMLDIEKTIGKSIQTFGVPIQLLYKVPKKKKTKIDVILDVSGSVIKSAEFLSLFAYLLHMQFPSQVRIFSFVGLLDETTHFFQSDDIEQAIKNSLSNASIDYRGYSNYDLALKMYEEKYSEQVDENTILFFLGDARNNRHESNVHTFGELKKKAKCVFWFNPEQSNKWNQGDSIINTYKPHCNALYETDTLNKIIDALEESASIIEEL